MFQEKLQQTYVAVLIYNFTAAALLETCLESSGSQLPNERTVSYKGQTKLIQVMRGEEKKIDLGN